MDEKDKLQHDFLNSIVIINNITKSSSSFIKKTPNPEINSVTYQKQLEIFLHSMEAIREQTSKLVLLFNKALE